ncbi:MAG: hypothetical protein FD549_000092 [Pelagibacterales bacterium]|jgi:hypothetical protein|nr:hypothetical protein [Pelagibacterales bacterium]
MSQIYTILFDQDGTFLETTSDLMTGNDAKKF